MQGAHMLTPGLQRPRLTNNAHVTGATTDTWRKENKKRRIDKLINQNDDSKYWKEHKGLTILPQDFQ